MKTRAKNHSAIDNSRAINYAMNTRSSQRKCYHDSSKQIKDKTPRPKKLPRPLFHEGIFWEIRKSLCTLPSRKSEQTLFHSMLLLLILLIFCKKNQNLLIQNFAVFIMQRRPRESLAKMTGGNNIQLSPEGEVNSGGYIPRREASRYIYLPLFTDPEGDSCFSIYQIRWIKNCCFNFFF